jgi:Holliday junction resolvase RusA-like endonuclease
MKKFEIALPGEVPAKKNSRTVTKGGKNFPSKRHKKWHDFMMPALCSARRSAEIMSPIQEPCAVYLRFYHSTHRRRDCDNQTSSVLDLLVDAGILADDSWQVVRLLHVFSCEGEVPSVTIVVMPIDTEMEQM